MDFRSHPQSCKVRVRLHLHSGRAASLTLAARRLSLFTPSDPPGATSSGRLFPGEAHAKRDQASCERLRPLKLAHECQDQGRSFFHLTFGDGQHLMSVVITRREGGESLGNGARQATRDGFQLAALESDDFLVYTVSDLPAQANAAILAAFAPSLRAFLNQA